MLLKKQLEILAYSKFQMPESKENVERNKYLAHNRLLRNTWQALVAVETEKR